MKLNPYGDRDDVTTFEIEDAAGIISGDVKEFDTFTTVSLHPRLDKARERHADPLLPHVFVDDLDRSPKGSVGISVGHISLFVDRPMAQAIAEAILQKLSV